MNDYTRTIKLDCYGDGLITDVCLELATTFQENEL